jgi:hypothetical protein
MAFKTAPLTIARGWEEFDEIIGPASPIQKKMLKQAFFAGAMYCLQVQRDIAQTVEDDDEGQMRFNELYEEISKFAASSTH